MIESKIVLIFKIVSMYFDQMPNDTQLPLLQNKSVHSVYTNKKLSIFEFFFKNRSKHQIKIQKKKFKIPKFRF